MPPDAKLFVDLAELLSADDDDAIRSQPGQQSLNAEKQTRLRTAVVAVKHVAVIGVDKAAHAPFSDQRRGCQPAMH